jgi:glycine hydroxymethyltransferase
MFDSEVVKIWQAEVERQKNSLQMIASENFASPEVMMLSGSAFTNKYCEGYPGKRYYNGIQHYDEIENLAISYAKRLYGAKYVNVQPHSGAQANAAVFLALLEPGDTIMGMDLASGGHLTHGAKVNMSGKWFNSVTYGVDEKGLLDYDKILETARKHKPSLLICGASSYPRQIDWKKFNDIAKRCGAWSMADFSHYSGLIAGGVYDNPLPHMDVCTSTTHKTLRGPRGGMILTNDQELSLKINKAVFPGTQGGPLMQQIAAKAQAYWEASQPEFKTYQKSVVANARALSSGLIKNGIDICTGGTDSHIVLCDLREFKITGIEAANRLEHCKFVCNKNGIPNDTAGFIETSGIRLGTAAETTRGLNEEDFEKMGELILSILISKNAKGQLSHVFDKMIKKSQRWYQRFEDTDTGIDLTPRTIPPLEQWRKRKR